MGRILGAALLVIAAAAAVVAVWPQLFGLAQADAVAQIVSLRSLSVAVALVAVVGLTLLALLAPGARRFVASLAAVLLVFSVVQVIVLSTRGFGSEGFQSATDSDVTVLSWNTLGELPPPDVTAQLAIDTGAEVIALPETTGDYGQAVDAYLTESGKPMQVFSVAYDDVSKARSTTLLISEELGEYVADPAQVTTATLPSVVATPADGSGATIVAVHAVAPIPGEMDNWRADLRWLAAACSGSNVILAGDFNSTLDHYGGLGLEGAALGGCDDAALVTDNAAVGTWPSRLPALLGSPIDHVMATRNWTFTGMRVIQSHDQYGSDHRPVLAQLTPTG
jgi:endonuclease/exonuclease/phosphatase (EEP) superfamily protein YafD